MTLKVRHVMPRHTGRCHAWVHLEGVGVVVHPGLDLRVGYITMYMLGDTLLEHTLRYHPEIYFARDIVSIC